MSPRAHQVGGTRERRASTGTVATATIGPLRWQGAHDGSPAALGYDRRGCLVGQVAYYDAVAGRGPGWVGYVRGHRVTGRCSSAELAQRLVVERAPSAVDRAG